MDGDTGKAFARLEEKGTKWPGFFTWLVLLGGDYLDSFGGWGYVGFFPDILGWILQEFMGKEIRDTVLGSFYEFYIRIKNWEDGLPSCKNLFWCNVLNIFF